MPVLPIHQLSESCTCAIPVIFHKGQSLTGVVLFLRLSHSFSSNGASLSTPEELVEEAFVISIEATVNIVIEAIQTRKFYHQFFSSVRFSVGLRLCLSACLSARLPTYLLFVCLSDPHLRCLIRAYRLKIRKR